MSKAQSVPISPGRTQCQGSWDGSSPGCPSSFQGQPPEDCGDTASSPKDLLLGRILKHRDILPVDSLKRKKRIFFWNNAWPQYELEDGEAWPEDSRLDDSAVLQLDSFCT